VKSDGLIILSTINRNLKSFAYLIVIAEYILRLLPRKSHQWSRFMKPDEMRGALERSGLKFTNLSGVTWNIFAGALQLSTNTDVNYFLTAERPN
jgi:2-polyprenyl-6-hydroxyphenyl methylase/3-demethylubiquinone-9 3-methyltransferase